MTLHLLRLTQRHLRQQRMFGLKGAKAGYALAHSPVCRTEAAGWQIDDPVFRKCVQVSAQ